MKTKFLLPLPALFFSLVSCVNNTPTTPELPLPPITLPKEKKKISAPKPVKKVEVKKPVLTPDPVAIPEIKVPRFEVPENLQPKVSDGINQGEFIELKW